ncbi:hypothetical protein ED733_000811 [Metarhizium rileyi]|uniref:Uncharacterized protein n=1 Tax=Metarhizium rileyi (strain RCEF 4871) TaxID=1649241 RepID=A0A5C6G806_METRR|nr:hypothetical protein ED733_000811 [Metarhizium rileyi]
MASKPPVPSRAALNALRGVVLTTSCSVILLAEERRRRLQLARAAIENARKLHTLQSNRGPVALAESHGPWENRFAEVDGDAFSVASLPRPRTSTRRRGRSHLIGTQNKDSSPENEKGQTRLMSRADRGRMAAKLSVRADFLSSGIDMANLETPRLSPLKPQIYPNLGGKALKAFAQPRASKPSPFSTEQATSDNQITPSHLATGAPETSEYEPRLDNMEPYGADPVRSAQLYLKKSSQEGLTARPFYNDATSALEQLLKDMELAIASHASIAERIDLAAKIFQTVAAFGPPPLPRAVRSLQSQGIRLLKLASTASPAKLTLILTTMLPLSKDPLKFLLPLMTCAQHGNNKEILRDVLRFLSQNARFCSWASGMLICRLLTRQAKTQSNFDQTKQLYRMLQDAGLFAGVDIPQSTKYKIRRLMAVLALEHGDDGFANTELEFVNKLDAKACKSDIGLQRRIITRKAALGQWTEVFSDIEALGQISNVQCIEFQRLLTKTADIFARNKNVYELKELLQRFVTLYKLNLKHRWIFAVLDHYAGHRQAELVFSWLHFCSSTGWQMDSVCHQRFFARCRKFWSFSEKSIQSLGQSLQASTKITTETDLETGESENELWRTMASLASNEEWKRLNEVYETACSAGTGNPAQCLRLAVLVCIKRSNPNFARASILIQSAYAKGHDVSEALTPLLLARLERGDEPYSLIHGALQMRVRVHDSAYNKAAQALSGSGNHWAAAEMCELAARENGDGELLYNEYNFANLVFAYTGSARYKALQSLLSGFTSNILWWHGSRICKETIKLAMKTTAMRSAAHPQHSEPHRQALDMLDDALMHVKKCRSTRDDRRAVLEAYVRLAVAPSTKSCLKTNGRFGNEAG